MKKLAACPKLLFFLTTNVLLAGGAAKAAELDWNNTGTDFNAKESYGAGTTAPSASNVEFFKTAETMQPQVTASINTAGLNFSVNGYDLTAVPGATLTLNGYGTSATGATSSAGAAIYSSITTGTVTIDAPLLLAANNGTSNSTIYQTGNGGSLTINGKISGSTTAIAMTITGGGTITLNGANDFSTGLILSGTTLGNGPATLALGNDSALGTGMLTFNSGNTIVASGGARNISNAVLFGASGIIAGSNDLTLSGTFTSSGSNSRSLTINNTASTTLSGNVFLSESNSNSRTLTINGSGALLISGSITNNSGANTAASSLAYSGTGTLTLSNAGNTYTGTTSISNGTVLVNGALTGSSATTVTANSGGTTTLAGTGQVTNGVTIGSSANVATVSGTAILAPGTDGTIGSIKTGALSFVTNAGQSNVTTPETPEFKFDIKTSGGLQNDQVQVTGALALGTGTTQFIGQDLMTAQLTGGTVITLATTTAGIAGNFAGLTEHSLYMLGANTYQISYGQDVANNLTLTTVVPEPATWGSLAGGAALLVLAQRGRGRNLIGKKS